MGKLETAGFDLILSSYVFHFIQNKEDCVRALCQVLNVGGHLMITTTEDTRADSLAGSRRHLPMLQLHDLRNLRSSRVLSGRILFSMRPCAGADEQEIERRNARLKHCFIEPGAAVCEMAERQSGVQRVALEVGEAGYCYSSLDHMLAWFFAMTSHPPSFPRVRCLDARSGTDVGAASARPRIRCICYALFGSDTGC